ncbi:ATP-binding protein [Cellulomonas sp. Leaf334]|uniref:AAA family ATPase n=1 Tax=Cellulomonas sp. Leaf334 TaxID=1736339 RepID=UPI0006F733DE|nr:DUF234 domain-containing protein [Cellulomonas sp. Leaf334]KQR11752.1 hypothetical protein ASF78_10985 [Cellulomonas sp. Leaf334]
MVVPALSPGEVAEMLELEPADAFDAYLVTGGLPLILDEWERGWSLTEFLGSAVSSPTSALLVSAERALAAEFPTEAQARSVLGTIGAGERTFTTIGREAGGLQRTSLSRSLTTLTSKRVVAAERPLSTTTSTATRYRVADPYLRFWLAFLVQSLPEIERGRGDRVLARIQEGWSTWRGRAIEPVLREALDRLPLAEQPGGGGAVGAYWTRTNVPEIDVVIADRAPVAKQIRAVGSITWHEEAAFDRRDRDELIAHRAQMPGATSETPLFAIARNGSTVPDLETFGPEQLLQAWSAPE